MACPRWTGHIQARGLAAGRIIAVKSVAQSAAQVAAPILGKRSLAEAELMLNWTEIVGESLARVSRPLKLSFPRVEGGAKRDGTLQLRVLSAAALELQHMEPMLIERINGFFGYGAVSKIALRQGPIPNTGLRRTPPPKPLGAADEQRLKRNLGNIQDDELRQALERLGRAVLGSTIGR
jgi:hypothetical protein